MFHPLQLPLRQHTGDLNVFCRHFCWSCHVFIYTTTNKTQHMTVSPDSPQHSWSNSLFSVLYILNIHRLKAEVESERYVSLKMQGGISACCLPLIQSFKWHEKQQRSLRGVTSVCLWRKKHLQTYPAFLQWQERKRKQRLGGHVSMEEHQPSAAAKARQTMTLKPFCVSKTRKVLHRLESKSFPFFFFFCSCHTRTFAVHSGPSALIDWPTCIFTDKKVTRQPCQHRLQGVPVLCGSMEREYQR